MISGKTIKKSTAIVVGSIIALSLITMNVSYSSFFSVQTQNNVQTITTGTLEVTASASKVEPGEMMPTDAYEQITSKDATVNKDTANNKITLTVTNNGSVNALFGASIKRTGESANAADLKYVIVAIQKNMGSSKEWITFGENGPYYTAIADLVPETNSGSGFGAYPIIYDTIAKNGGTATTQTYDIYIWLSNETPEEEQGKTINLSVTAKSAPEKGQGEGNSIQEVKKSTSAIGLASKED